RSLLVGEWLRWKRRTTMPDQNATSNANVVLTADTTAYQQSMQQSASATQVVTNSVVKLYDAMYKLTASAGKKLIGIGAAETAGLVAATAAAGKLQEQ